MNQTILVKSPLVGETYTLYRKSDNTDDYYNKVKDLVDNLLEEFKDELFILNLIKKHSSRRFFLRRQLWIQNSLHPISLILKKAKEQLSIFTEPVAMHLKKLSLLKRLDKTIATTREQYFLYMIEIELANRLFKRKINSSEIKFAFLPHCLHDLSKNCMAVVEKLDYVCKGCSKLCQVNMVSKILRDHNFQPYIWREANLNSLFKKLKEEKKSISVLGIACIVELVNGMRLCRRFDVPAVGIPLDANRCARWMGEFYDTSVNVKKLEELINF